MARVKTHVHAVDPKTHEVTVLNPGDEVPKHLADVVTNPKALQGGEDEDEDEDAPPDPNGDSNPYDGMKNTELREELEKRGLPTSGNQAELIARLVESDQADQE